METAGSLLKSEREKKQKTLKDIADATKISMSVLKAMEEGRAELLPALSYVRGFLKLYAAELDLDPYEVVELYEKGLKKRKNCNSQKKHNYYPVRKIPYFTAGAVFLVLLIAYFVNRNANPEKKLPDQPVNSVTTTVRDTPDRKEARTPFVPEKEGGEDHYVIPGGFEFSSDDARHDALKQNENFTVRFVARELTWIKITADDRETFDIMLRAGEAYRKTVKKSMKVRIGNGGGLLLFFNDIPLGVPGEQGKPLNLLFPEAAEDLQN